MQIPWANTPKWESYSTPWHCILDASSKHRFNQSSSNHLAVGARVFDDRDPGPGTRGRYRGSNTRAMSHGGARARPRVLSICKRARWQIVIVIEAVARAFRMRFRLLFVGAVALLRSKLKYRRILRSDRYWELECPIWNQSLQEIGKTLCVKTLRILLW
jgi:hypothetical protein